MARTVPSRDGGDPRVYKYSTLHDFCHARAVTGTVGRTYAPFLLANDAAIAAGDETFSRVIDGHGYSQGTFVYQRKCLAWLREQHASLSPSDRAAVNAMLAGTGCEVLFG